MSEQVIVPRNGPLASAGTPHASKKPHPVDLHVGRRVQARRKQLGMSQEGLAAALGVTFQQVQKYEHGGNRISASRLQNVADILGVPVSHFFEGAADQPQRQQPASEIDRFLSSDDGAALADAFSRIRDPALRRSIAAFVATVADAGEQGEARAHDAAPPLDEG